MGTRGISTILLLVTAPMSVSLAQQPTSPMHLEGRRSIVPLESLVVRQPVLGLQIAPASETKQAVTPRSTLTECPMPVIAPDSSRSFAGVPVTVRPLSARMPTAPAPCHNPLASKR